MNTLKTIFTPLFYLGNKLQATYYWQDDRANFVRKNMRKRNLMEEKQTASNL